MKVWFERWGTLVGLCKSASRRALEFGCLAGDVMMGYQGPVQEAGGLTRWLLA